MGATYCARCLLPVTFAPGRAFAMCPACDAALRLAPEPRHPGTALADDDVAGYPMAARAADRRAGLTAALAALEDEWRAGRWGRLRQLLGPRRSESSGRVRRGGCYVFDLGCSIFMVIGGAVVAIAVVNESAEDGSALPLAQALTALAWTVVGAFFAWHVVAWQLKAIANHRSERAAYQARRTALRTALGSESTPPRDRGDDQPRLV